MLLLSETNTEKEKMDRREFLKSTLSLAAPAPPAQLKAPPAIAGIDHKTSGFPKEQLLQIEGDTPVPDFQTFWQAQYAAARAWKCSCKVEGELWSPDPDCRIFRIRFTSIDGFSIGMWLARPRESTGGKLLAHGYGNPQIPPVASSPGRTIVMPCVPGLALSQCKEIPWKSGDHARFGADSPEHYVITDGVRNLWIALTILIDMFPDTADNILCSGGSLGGGMGALAIPWDERIHYGNLNVPTLGGRIMLDYPGNPDTPGESRRRMALAGPEGMRIIDLCNASAAARFIRVPTVVTPALRDAVVPPPGQFAVANSIPEPYRILRIREVGHAPATEADQVMLKELDAIREKVFVSRRGQAPVK